MNKFKLLLSADKNQNSIADNFRSVPLFSVSLCSTQRMDIISNCMITRPDALLLCASDNSEISENVSALLRLSKHTEIFIMKFEKISLDYPLPSAFKILSSSNSESAAEELIFRSSYFENSSDKQVENFETRIEKAVDELGFTANYVGMTYVCDALGAILSGEINASKGGFCKTVYPYIAKRRRVTSSSVERSMRTAIAKSWMKITDEIKDKYFGMAFRGFPAPSNRAYILIVAEKLARDDD